MGNTLHYIIRMCAYVYARKEKGIVLTEMKRFSSTYSAFKKNASAFDIKRKGVSLQTQGRFSSNASAFWMERKGVFFTNKNKRKYYTEKGIKKGVPLNSNLC